MKNEDHLALLERAAKATMERIHGHRSKAPEKLKELFAYLEEHLFERGLDVNSMRRACGKRSNTISTEFAEVTGEPPRAYIVARRVETAETLLRDTELELHFIAKLLGFSKHGLLCQNFKAHHGITPSEYRLCSRQRHQNISGRVLPAKKKEPEKPYLFSSTKEEREIIKVEELWEVLRSKPWAEQREMIQNRIALPTPVLSHFLRKKSIPEGRSNRGFGIHLAELALECLKVTERVLGEELFELRAQGWVWIGNARRLADELEAAERAFSIAYTFLGHQEKESLVTAEFYGMKSALRRWQRRLEEASELHDRALPLFRTNGTLKDIAASLIDGAYTCERSGKDEESIPYLQEALSLAGAQEESFLEFAACFNLANAFIKTGAFEHAKNIMPRVRATRNLVDSWEGSTYHLQWLEGRLSQGFRELTLASTHYQAACNGFLELGQNIEASLVSLDLALLYWKQDRIAEVTDLTLNVIPLLEAFQYHDDAGAGLTLLRSAIEKQALTENVLQQAREHLDRTQNDPWSYDLPTQIQKGGPSRNGPPFSSGQ